MNKLRIRASVYTAIRDTVGRKKPETGGMLGGNLDTGEVTHFYFDELAKCTVVAYSPHLERIGPVLRGWNAMRIRLMGFVHSHDGFLRPSGGDFQYARTILEANPGLPYLVMPIIVPGDDEEFRICWYVATLKVSGGVSIQAVPCEVVDDPFPSKAEIFQRVTDAYDIPHLAKARVGWVGTGGASGIAEGLARAGIGEFILIDPGLVEACNVGTQAFHCEDIGKAKVGVVADRIRRINPHVQVVGLTRRFQDFSEVEIADLFAGEGPRLIMGSTDDFFAQARVNRVALNLGIPSVCCQLYDRSYAGEVTYTHPDITRSCGRCILSSRYRAFLEEGYVNPVGSNGSPYTSSSQLNSLTAWVALALLHHGTEHPRWGDLITRIGQRNLIQIRCHPDVSNAIGLTNFDEVLKECASTAFFSEDVIWREQTPEHSSTGYAPACPDCGGGGDLRAVMGRFTDTNVPVPRPSTLLQQGYPRVHTRELEPSVSTQVQ